MHIYRRADGHPQSIKHGLPHTLLDIVQCIYMEGRWMPSQLSIDDLHTATPTARYSTMHIYRRQMNPPGQLSRDALHTATPIARYNTMHIYRRQMDHQIIEHRCLAYCYTHCQIKYNAYI